MSDQIADMRKAILSGDVESIRKMLVAGASPEINLGSGRRFESPLLVAAQAMQIEACRLLLQFGADAKGSPEYDCIPLRSAAGQTHVAGRGFVAIEERVALCLLLLEHGADPHEAGRDACETAMHLGFRQGRGEDVVPLLRLLVSFGGDPSYVPPGAAQNYLTPLQKEVQVCGLLMRLQRPSRAGADKLQTWDLGLKFMFLEVGVDPFQKTVRGRSLLQLCEANMDETKDLIRQVQQDWRARKTQRSVEEAVGVSAQSRPAPQDIRSFGRSSGPSL